ncbi:non-ribosomal peptide synthetase [Pseudoalteromonas viridis]|uniref:Amino acid adenylation domain-containing protein n=1 Tax=Pseudoalteromonas viridis TaxID=339617 RepID=A0ABX7V6Z2_9GAMM|nr:non-ribosomal peptide synthetase [Pseudoalteromonas viridis]QTL36669.1 amino acid adenylation domain-containing protein [Pseudoalteromonas viridis]
MEQYKASAPQYRFWLTDKLEPDRNAYNVFSATRLVGELNLTKLQHAIEAVVDEQPQLRAHFVERSGTLMVNIAPELAVSIELHTVGNRTLEEVLGGIRAHKFDLTSGPLFQFHLIEVEPDHHIFVAVVHHIIIDGQSMSLLVQTIADIYNDAPRTIAQDKVAEPETVRSPTHQERFFWQNKFQSEIQGVAFPADIKLATTHALGVIRTPLKTDLTQQIEAFCKAQKVTETVFYLSVYAYFVSVFSQTDKFCFGIPVNIRAMDQAHSVGNFINTVPVSVDLSQAPTFNALLATMSQEVASCIDHAEVSFEQIVELSGVQREAGVHPLFQTLVAFQPSHLPKLKLDGLNSASFPLSSVDTKFPVSFYFDFYDEQLHCSIEYDAGQFSEQTVDYWSRCFVSACQALLTNADAVLTPTVFVHPTDPVFTSADTTVEAFSPFFDKIFTHAASAPDTIAIYDNHRSVTYQQVVDNAKAVANNLLSLGVKSGDIIGVCMQRNSDMYAVMLGVMVAGASYVGLDAKYPRSRLNYIVEDAQCRYVICDPRYDDLFDAVTCIEPEKVFADIVVERVPGKVKQDEIAYLIYTSGSTGNPKGVMVRHESVDALIQWSSLTFGELDKVLASTSICFDISVFELFAPLACGGSVIMVDDIRALAEPLGCEPLLINTVPSAAQELVKLGLIPKSVKVINLAGEPLTRKLVDSLYALEHIQAVYNLYGPSEDTTYSTYELVQKDSAEEPNIGVPISGTSAYVLDKNRQLLPYGVEGELYLSGVGIAAGYLNKPELSAEKFIVNPFAPEQRMYQTGDKVRWRQDGKLDYLGRLDHQIKLRGFRIETGEIEAQIRAVKGVSNAVVILTEVAEQKHLAAYYEGAAYEALVEQHLAQVLPVHMVPTFLIQLDALPLNSNGKIDRKQLPDVVAHTEDVAELVLSKTQELVVKAFEQIFTGVPIGLDSDFFKLGGHSLLAMQLSNTLFKLTSVKLPLSRILQLAKVREIATSLDQALAQSNGPDIEATGRNEGPLSKAQERMYLIHRLRNNTSILHLNYGLELTTATLDLASFKQALTIVSSRYSALRTLIKEHDNVYRQQVVAQCDIDQVLTVKALHSKAALHSESELDANEPFDLSSQFPWRVFVYCVGDEVAGVVFVFHHIAVDGVAVEYIFRTLEDVYASLIANQQVELEVERYSAIDYAVWQSSAPEFIREQALSYWQEALADLPTALNLPRKYDADVMSRRCARLTRTFEGVQNVSKLASELATTPFSIFLACYKLVLSKVCRSSDIVVGTPIALREHSDLFDHVGCLLNTVAIRSQVEAGMTLSELIDEVQRNIRIAQQYGHVSFEDVIAALNIPSDMTSTPVFQTIFVLQNASDNTVELADTSARSFGIVCRETQFDVSMMVELHNNEVMVTCDYRADLYDEKMIDALLCGYQAVLEQVVLGESQTIDNIALQRDARKSMSVGSALRCANKAVAQHVLEWANLQPDAIAIRTDERQISYQQLATEVHRLANSMLAQGLSRLERVLICQSSSADAVIAALAVNLAGGVFILVEPTLPVERINQYLHDAQVAWCYCDIESIATHLVVPGFVAPQQEVVAQALPPLDADALAYIIYTSGSTGKPKGVAVSNAGFASLRSLFESLEIGAGHSVMQYAPFSFDAAIWDIAMGLCTGATLCFKESGRLLPGRELAEFITAHEVSVITMPPSNARGLTTDQLSTLNMMFFAGESVQNSVLEYWHDKGKRKVFNAYGPSENTVCATVYAYNPAVQHKTPPIGHAISGNSLSVVDQHGQTLPNYLPGEIVVSGNSVANGYWGSAELTRRAFIPGVSGLQRGLSYRTGDLGVMDDERLLHFHGRIDDQVKVNGVRIEPGEIKATIAALQYPLEHLEVLKCENKQVSFLAVFYTVQQGKQLDLDAIQHALASKLPQYMLPSSWIQLERFPLTANGKVDKRALVAQATAGQASDTIRAAENELQNSLVTLWADLLEVSDETVCIDTPFFQQGGTSMLLLRMVDRLAQLHTTPVTAIDLFTYKTVRELAAFLEQKSSTVQSVSPETIFEL